MVTRIKVPPDSKEHVLDGSPCWCGSITAVNVYGEVMIIHRDALGIALNLHPVIYAEPRKECG